MSPPSNPSPTGRITLAQLMERASRLESAQHWNQAQSCLQEALALAPRQTGIQLRLSEVHARQDHYRQARAHALQCLQSPLPPPEQALEVIRRLRLYNESAAIRQMLARLPPPSALPIPVLLGLASVLSSINDQTGALALLEEAVRGDPDYPPSLFSRAQVLGYFGQFDRARADIERALARAPQAAQGHWLFARLRTATTASNSVPRLRQWLAKASNDRDKALLGYALHKELDDLGDYPAAWHALSAALIAKRATLRYDSATSEALITDLIRTLPSVVAEANPTPSKASTPIFIVGMHRSGTTLLERILGGHPQIAEAGELYDFTAQMRLATDHHCAGVIDRQLVERAAGLDYPQIGERYLQATRWRARGLPVFTDKLPSNFLNLGYIARALPHARILHLVRDPMDTCLSNLRELFSDACPFSYDQIELADYYRQYRRLMEHWHETLPGRILDVSYADLVQDSASTVRRIVDFCGLRFEDSMLAIERNKGATATASSLQVRSGIHRNALSTWQRYDAQLQPLRDRLGELPVHPHPRHQDTGTDRC